VDVEGTVLDGGCDAATADGRGVLGEDDEFVRGMMSLSWG